MGNTRCPLCEGLARELPPAKIPLYHCTICDLMYKGQSMHLNADEERRRYETHDNTLQNLGYVRMFQEFIAGSVTPFVKQDAVILDFGSGPTPVLKHLLEQQGFKVDVYDPFFAPSIISNVTYDCITCTEVLEHVFDPMSMWKRLLSLLSSDGVLALMTHFHLGTSETPSWWYLRDNTHVTFYSARTFAWVAQKFALDILYNDEVKTVVLKRHPY